MMTIHEKGPKFLCPYVVVGNKIKNDDYFWIPDPVRTGQV
jgi:hypothetical protein